MKHWKVFLDIVKISKFICKTVTLIVTYAAQIGFQESKAFRHTGPSGNIPHLNRHDISSDARGRITKITNKYYCRKIMIWYSRCLLLQFLKVFQHFTGRTDQPTDQKTSPQTKRYRWSVTGSPKNLSKSLPQIRQQIQQIIWFTLTVNKIQNIVHWASFVC